MQPDRKQIDAYLQTLFAQCEEGYVEVRPIKDNQVDQKFFDMTSLSDAADFVESVAGQKHAFCGVCPRGSRDGSAQVVSKLVGVWADVDVKDFAEGKLSVLQHVKESSPMEPSLIVDSGHGYHLYWLLNQPADIDHRREKAKKLIRRYHTAVGGDSTHDLARILRIPGTHNIKNPDDPIICQIEAKSDISYTLRELAEAVQKVSEVGMVELRKRLPQRVLQRAQKAPEKFQGDRSGNDFYVAQQMSRAGLSRDEIEEAFDLFAQKGWDAGDKYNERGDVYLSHILQGSVEDQQDRLESLLEIIRDSEGIPNGEVDQACQIMANLPPVKRDLMEHELKDALGGRSSVSIKSIRKQVELSEGGVQAPETAAAAGRELLDRREYINLDGQLHVYEDGVFLPKGKELIREDLQELLGSKWSRNKRDNAIDWVKDRTYTKVDYLPENEGLINCNNCVYDIHNNVIHEHSPEYRFIWQVDAEYDPEAQCDRLDEFMEEVFHQNDIQVAWEHCGYCILPWVNLKKFLILLGSGDNGKSVFLNMIEHVLGKESVSHESLRTLTGNRFSTKELFGKLANICADITADRVKHVEILKALTGGDKIRAEIKHGNTFSFRNEAALIFSANRVPRVSEISEAFFNRLHLIRCPNTFPPGEADPNLISKLTTKEAKSAWLNKAIEGGRRLLQQRRFTTTENIEGEISHYRRTVDNVTEFIQDQLVKGGFERHTTLYSAYADWCKRSGRQPVSSMGFKERVQMKPNNLKMGRRTLDNKVVNVWEGISLRTN